MPISGLVYVEKAQLFHKTMGSGADFNNYMEIMTLQYHIQMFKFINT
jgi:hypothetical protein